MRLVAPNVPPKQKSLERSWNNSSFAESGLQLAGGKPKQIFFSLAEALEAASPIPLLLPWHVYFPTGTLTVPNWVIHTWCSAQAWMVSEGPQWNRTGQMTLLLREQAAQNKPGKRQDGRSGKRSVRSAGQGVTLASLHSGESQPGFCRVRGSLPFLPSPQDPTAWAQGGAAQHPIPELFRSGHKSRALVPSSPSGDPPGARLTGPGAKAGSFPFPCWARGWQDPPWSKGMWFPLLLLY